MKRILIFVLVVSAIACTQKPKIASEANVAPVRQAIAVEYVAIPTMTVYATPDPNAQTVGSYGFNESISVLARNGEWCEIRTFDGSGWVKAADLMTAEQSKAASEHPVPRFYVPPAAVPYGGHGQIVLQAKVNTSGEVYDVLQVSNSTNNPKIAEANAAALKAARFYPLIDKGQRKTFVYEHRIVY